MTYRACWYESNDENPGELLLTGPEHSQLPDGQLIEVAVTEARHAREVAGVFQMPDDDLRAHLRIGEWTE